MPLHPTFQKFRNCRQALSCYSTALLSPLCLTSGLNTCTFRHHPSVLSFLSSSIRLHLAPSVTLNQLGEKSEDSPHFTVPLVDITDGAKHPHLQMPCRSLYSRDSGRLGGKDGEREGDVGPPACSPQQGRRNGVRVSSKDKDKRQNIPILHAFLPETRKKKNLPAVHPHPFHTPCQPLIFRRPESKTSLMLGCPSSSVPGTCSAARLRAASEKDEQRQGNTQIRGTERRRRKGEGRKLARKTRGRGKRYI